MKIISISHVIVHFYIPLFVHLYNTIYTCEGYDDYETPAAEFRIYTPTTCIYAQKKYTYNELQWHTTKGDSGFISFPALAYQIIKNRTEYKDVRMQCFYNPYDCYKTIVDEIYNKGTDSVVCTMWGKSGCGIYDKNNISKIKNILASANLMEDAELSLSDKAAKLMDGEVEPDIEKIIESLKENQVENVEPAQITEDEKEDLAQYEKLLEEPFSELSSKPDLVQAKELLTSIGGRSCEVKYDLGYFKDEEKKEVAVYKTETINAGEKLTKPEDPVLEGCDFVGWYYMPSSAVKEVQGTETKLDIEKDGVPWDFSNDAVQDSMTLSAIWSRIRFTPEESSTDLCEIPYGEAKEIKLGKLSAENFDGQAEYTIEVYNEYGTEKLTEDIIKGEVRNCQYDSANNKTEAELYVTASKWTPTGKYQLKVKASDGTHNCCVEDVLKVVLNLDEGEVPYTEDEINQIEKVTEILNYSELSEFNGDGVTVASSKSIKNLLGEKGHVKIQPKNAEFEEKSADIKKISFYVTPMKGKTVVNNSEITSSVTFRLPVPDSMDCSKVEVLRDGKSIGDYKVLGKQPNRYVEISSEEFSCYTIKPFESKGIFDSGSFKADVGGGGVINGTEKTFVDISGTDYYYNPVVWAVDRGITSGVDATHFAPKNITTRAQMVTFLWRLSGSPEPGNAANPFVDVNSSEYYYKAVLWAIEKGITSGIDTTHFNPNGAVDRAQSVTFLYRAAGSKAVANTYITFKDVKSGSYYSDAVLWAFTYGITSGTSESTFSPVDNCTRGQIVTLLYRYDQKKYSM